MDASRTLPPRVRPPRREDSGHDRRWRLTHRTFPLLAIAGVALLAGIVFGALHVPPERDAAKAFGAAWQRGDYAAMHRLLTADARARTPLARFVAAYRETGATATAVGVRVGQPEDPEDGVVPLPVSVRTRIFGVVKGTLRLPFAETADGSRVTWIPELTFPGVAAGQALTRRTEMPPRGTILARDGQVLARGADRSSDLDTVATEIVGELGPVPPEDYQRLRAQGVPDDARVGISGLERALQDELAGRPGGTLSVAGKVVARARPRTGPAVRTTISPKLEEAAITALAGRSGGVAVLRPDGQVLALSGIAFSGLGPPGSTFKVITTVGALENRTVSLKDSFPVETAAVLEGVSLSNASGESCGGSFENSFAHSCNSVFAPLGAKLGAKKLVEYAERFGWNEPPAIKGAKTSTLPPADQVGDDLAVGSTAIGQGKVLASALQMASVAQVIANRGIRVQPTLVMGRRGKVVRVTTPAIAATLRNLMVGVVREGTGKSAQIDGVSVAGKTGTAELGLGPGGSNDPGNTDAWFLAFAPAKAPRFAVGVVILRGGAGGDAAAPVARDVLVSGLKD